GMAPAHASLAPLKRRPSQRSGPPLHRSPEQEGDGAAAPVNSARVSVHRRRLNGESTQAPVDLSSRRRETYLAFGRSVLNRLLTAEWTAGTKRSVPAAISSGLGARCAPRQREPRQ